MRTKRVFSGQKVYNKIKRGKKRKVTEISAGINVIGSPRGIH